MGEIRVGQLFSHYRIIEKLGQGGMGIVYKAEDVKLNRLVALKFLPPSFSSDEDAKKRFITEAQTASALDHPNIYSIYEICETDEPQLFISMAHYQGETLKNKITKSKIEINEAINIVLQVCEGLNKAHRNKIVHRDIKPANIFITNEGIVKILDFGIAKIKDQQGFTQDGTTAGTVDYMSPEQARGETVDDRTDIWSLGIIFYEMLAGSNPFKADYDQAVIYSILNKDPDLNKIPKQLRSIIKKALSKPINRRYQNVKELILDLLLFEKTSLVKKYIPLLSHKRLNLITKLLGASLLIISAALILYLNEYKQTAHPLHASVSDRKMIVVLPFENLGSPEDEFFARGIREEISNKLASFGDLGVISRNSAEKYSKLEKTTKEIGKELGVDYILEGTLQWAVDEDRKSRVRIIPQLIRVSDDVNIWSDSYDRIFSDIFNVQNEIAEHVAINISDSLTSAEFKKVPQSTYNMGAYTYYLQGLELENVWYYFKIDYLEREKLFEKAIELDPDFALAYAHLSITKSGMYEFYYDRSIKTKTEALHYAQKAFKLDKKLADAHFALASYYNGCDGNIDKASKEFTEVLRIKPNDVNAISALAGILKTKGDFQPAVQYLLKAASLDPLSIWPLFDLAETYRWMRDYKNAEKYFKILITRHPDLSFTKAQLAQTYIDWKGDIKTASRLIKDFKSVDEDYFNFDYTVSVLIDEIKRDYNRAIKTLLPLNQDTTDELNGYFLKKLELGLIYRFKNDITTSRLYFDSTRIQLEKLYKANPLEHRLHTVLAISYAGLGLREKAIDQCNKWIEKRPIEKSALLGYRYQKDLATVYILLEDYDNALKKIDFLLSRPGSLTVNQLKLHPLYDPLRNLSEYQQIIKKYSNGI